jgi:3-oxoacyl-[acyl-carrier protein] reductase
MRVVITGASRGIGRAIALACAKSGATVGVNFHRTEPEPIDGAMPLRFDVADPHAVEESMQTFIEQHGGIDVLVNNAGVNLPALLASASDSDIDAMIRTNLHGTIYCTRAVIPAMLRQRGGVIINMSSVAAERPFRGQAVYAATKGAIESFTRAIAVEYGRKGIRSHCIRPGPVDTDMFAATKAVAGDEVLSRIPLRRYSTTDDVAKLALFLMSDDASGITGAIHTVDGGFTAG